jgi:hypothetical protein
VQGRNAIRNGVILTALLCVAVAAAYGDEGAAEKRGSRMQGKAASGRRAPVVGATVIARQPAGDPTVWVTTTGPGGTFRMDGMPDGTYSVEFRRDGMTSVTKEGVEVKFPFRAVVEVEMQPGEALPPAVPANAASGGSATVDGIVTDPGGSPLADIRLRLVRPDGAQDPRSARTDAAGRFEFSDLSTGPWRAEISGVGYLTIRGRAAIAGDAAFRIFLVKQPAGYDPSPLDLMPPEQPIPPEGLN